MSLNDSETRKFQAIVSRVDRGSKSKLDRLHLTDGKKWGRRDLGEAWVTWPHRIKAGDLVEIESKITRLDGGIIPMFPYNSLWNFVFIVLFLLAVSLGAGAVASALFHIEGLGGQCSAQVCITNGPPSLSWVSLIVFIAVFIGLWHPFVNHLERHGGWGIWEIPAREPLLPPPARDSP